MKKQSLQRDHERLPRITIMPFQSLVSFDARETFHEGRTVIAVVSGHGREPRLPT